MDLATSACAEDGAELVLQRCGIADAYRPIAYHPSTKHLLTTHSGVVILWDVDAGLAVRSFGVDGGDNPHVSAVGFSPDGARVLIGGRYQLDIRDTQSGEVAVTVGLPRVFINDARLSPDGRWIAAACADRSVVVWDAVSGDLHRVLEEGHRLAPLVVCFSPDSTTLVSGGEDDLAILWDVESGEVVHRLPSPTDVRHIAFRDDGRMLLTRGSGGYWYTPRIAVWDVASVLPVQVIPRSVRSAWFAGDAVQLLHHDGKREVWASDRHELAPSRDEFPRYRANANERLLVDANHWSLYTRIDEPVAVLTSPTGEATPLSLPHASAERQEPLAFSADGRWLVSGGGYNASHSNAILWDLREGRMHRNLIPADLAAFHPDGERVAVGLGRMIALFDIHSGKMLQTYAINKGSFESLQFVDGGEQMLTASGDWYDGDEGQVLLWDVETGKRLRNYEHSDKAAMHARMTPDGKEIVASFTPGHEGSAGIDQISVLDAGSGQPLREFTHSNYRQWFSGGMLDPSGRAIVGEFHGRNVVLWERETLQLRRQFPPGLGPMSPDGEILAIYGKNGRLSFWNTETGDLLVSHLMHLQQPRDSMFHPGGQLYVGSMNPHWEAGLLPGRSIGVWKIATGELQAELLTFDKGRDWLIRTTSGHLSGSDGGLTRVAWREAGTANGALRAALTQSHVDSAEVGNVLSQSLPEGVSLLASLPRSPPPVFDEPEAAEQHRRTPHNYHRDMRDATISALREAGGHVEVNTQGYVTAVDMKGRPVLAELAQRLTWIGSANSVNLTATGITDDELEWVGMMSNVRRLSLAGNPVTDAGLARLAGLWNLEFLDVHDTPVTAEGLNHLRLIEQLERLIVPDHVDVADLQPLRRIPNLRITRRRAGEKDGPPPSPQ